MHDAAPHIVELFIKRVSKHPDKPAIIEKHHTTSFGELEKRARLRAQRLSEQGVGPGTSVLVYVPMSTTLYEVLIAILWLGAKAVFIDSWADHKRLIACLKQTPVDVVIADPKLRWLRPFYRSLRSLTKWISYSPASSSLQQQPQKSPDQVAIVTFTTGSTGAPKGAIRTHDFLHHQFTQLSRVITPDEQATALVSLPMVLLMNFASGATSIIPDISLAKPSFKRISKVATQLRTHQTLRVIASPSLLVHLAKAGPFQFITEVFTGGGPVFPEEAHALSEGFPKARIRIIYGSTEAEPVSDIGADTIAQLDDNKSIPAGKVNEHAQVAIIPLEYDGPWQLDQQQFSDLTQVAGKPGEIIACGPQVLSDYTDSAALETNKLRVGDQLWHRMGDAGFITDEGQLFLLGRCNETIFNANGTPIFPFVFARWSKKIDGMSEAVMLVHKEQRMIVASVHNTHKRSTIERKIREQWPETDKVVFLSRIPKDARHQTKVNMEELRRLMDRE